MGQKYNWVATFAAVLPLTLAAGCAGEETTDTVIDVGEDIGQTERALTSAEARGRDIWFNNTYGGELFFSYLAGDLPSPPFPPVDPAKKLRVGFDALLNTPRDQRFDIWGSINDPDCSANPNGGPDICPDPSATGVIGIRKSPGPGGITMYGAACASCHAGFDPTNPPADPNDPSWDNIHATIGNQDQKFGALFAANLSPGDPRGLVFASWPNGAVDTTALFSDNINNPGVVTAFWEHENRNRFDVGLAHPQLRNGQGGEDDLGDLAIVRVYTNIGACFFECTAPAVAAGTELDINACQQNCPNYPPQQDLDDVVDFLATFSRPKYPGYRSFLVSLVGRLVFEGSCESCHDNDHQLKNVMSNDEVNALTADPANTTNKCRSLTTNWEAGKLWGQFSSQVYKDRLAAGGRGYRSMPLGGTWATTPLLHNQSIGDYAPADATPQERAPIFRSAMLELMSNDRVPKINTIPFAVGPFPAGTPLAYVVNRDPSTGALLCDDVVENAGHHFGADLPMWQKLALIYYVQHQ
jgi:cytochrome c5